MYNVSEIKAGLIGLIGWRQNPDAAGTQLTGLTSTVSGLYYNDQHPHLTHDNLLSIAPDYSQQYALQADRNTAYTAWLQEKTEAGILAALDAWIGLKFQNRTARNLLERETLFDAAAGCKLDTNSSKVAGLEFVPTRSRSLKVTLEKFAVQFSENCTVTVYLYQSNVQEAVQSQEVTYTGNGGAQWVTVNWELDGTGSYLLCYDQAENPTIQSVNSTRDNTHLRGGITTFPCGRFFQARAFSVSALETEGIPDLEIGNDFIVAGDTEKFFAIEDLNYTLDTNFGLNVKLNVKCDYTELILDQKDLFRTLIAKQVAMNLLREIALNPNAKINRNQANVDSRAILYEIDGDTQGRKGGIKHDFEQALNAIQFDTTGIDKVCLPCRRRGVKYTVA